MANKLEETTKLYLRCLEDPSVFAKEVLGVQTWWMQDDIIRSVFKNRETAVRSCHNSGKTKVAGIATLAWLRLHPPGQALVITTSSSWEQVQQEIWGEIRNQLIPNSKWQWPKPNLVQLDMPGGSRAFGISTNDPVNFHGFHARYVLVIVDEASGISPEIFEAFAGLKAGGEVHFLYLMNPTNPVGPEVDLFKDPKVTPFTVDGLNTPNLDGYHIYEKKELNDSDPDKAHNLLYLPDEELDADPFPYLIRRRYVRDMYLDAIAKFGSVKPEAMWWPRVRGMPPGSGEDQLIQNVWLEQAHVTQVAKGHDTVVGIDVAGPGENETALCMRMGNQIIYETAWAVDDPYAEIVAVIGHPRPNLWINVDATGIGHGLAAALQRDGYQVGFCNAKNRPRDPSQFLNAKAEWYWGLRERFKDNEIGGPINPITRQQLLTIRWDQRNPKGLVRIEPKEDAAKRGVQSPDRAEAMMLCFAGGPQAIVTGPMQYDTSNIVFGSMDATPISSLQPDAGWRTDMRIRQTKELPDSAKRWMQAMEERKRASRPAVQAVLNQTFDPVERQRLISMLQSAD